MAREYYIVSVDRPSGCSVAEMKQHIQDAVSIHANGGHPEDPLFGHFAKRGNTVYAQRMGLGTTYRVTMNNLKPILQAET